MHWIHLDLFSYIISFKNILFQTHFITAAIVLLIAFNLLIMR